MPSPEASSLEVPKNSHFILAHFFLFNDAVYNCRYELMLQCWDKDPDKRPRFIDIIRRLNEILHTDEINDAHNQSADSDYYNLSIGVEATPEVDYYSGGSSGQTS